MKDIAQRGFRAAHVASASWLRGFRRAAVAVAFVCGLAVAPSQASTGYMTLTDGEVLRIALPDTAPRGLVLLLPDSLGGDPRSAPYVERLLAHGIVAAEPQWQRVPPSEQPERGQRLLAQARDAATRVGAPPDAIALVGFGFGARAASQAAIAHGWPAALLYPGCAGLQDDPVIARAPSDRGWHVALRPVPVTAPPVLLLHGSADPAEPAGACERLAARLGPNATRHVYFGATYGWDYAPGPWENMASLLPSPDGNGPLRRAHMSTGVTADAAARVADFIASHIAPQPGRHP